MKKLDILLFPDELLRKTSKYITDIDASTANFVEELVFTLHANKFCVGIAAPQVGVLKRIIVVDVTGSKKADKHNGLLMMLNPEITFAEGSSINREGCLSVPDYTGNVERNFSLCVKYLNINGKEQILKTSGFEAIVIQHEIDHLNGIIFLDKIKNLKRDLFRRNSPKST